MSEHDITSKIKSDLINTGIFLEQDTFQLFNKWGADRHWDIHREYPFDFGALANPTDGTIDILAVTGISARMPRAIVVPIECKKANPELKHWVFEPHRQQDKTLFFPYIINHESYFTKEYNLSALGYNTPPDYENAVNVFEFSQVNGKQSRSTNKEQRAFFAIRQANQAVAGLFQELNKVSSHEISLPHFMIPVVVTTANLWVTSYDPADINKSTGEIESDLLDLVKKDWVMYSYPLPTHESIEGRVRNGVIEPEYRPTFVVNSEKLQEFMSALISDFQSYIEILEVRHI